MAKTTSIYKTETARKKIMALYDQKLVAIDAPVKTLSVDTFAGKTHITTAGDSSLPPVVVLHGINAGAPVTLEAMEALTDEYYLIGIDTIGQATRSAETRLPLNNDSYGKWLAEVFAKLDLEQVPVVGVSYGGFLLSKLLQYDQRLVSKAIFVVPAGFTNGPLLKSMRKLTFPMIRFLSTKKDAHLDAFINAFYNDIDEYARDLQRTLLLGVKTDMRRPPLMKKRDAANIQTPVYCMAAEEDIFFPGRKTLDQVQKLFPKVMATKLLEGAKHVPDKLLSETISKIVRNWLTK